MATSPVFFFTDFGPTGPYLGQMEVAVLGVLPDARVISLLSDAPVARARPSAYLLKSLLPYLPTRAGVVAVVDPGVGTARRALCILADGRWLVGPDNGLLAPAARAAGAVQVWRLDWVPAVVSVSFHGRDLFAPACARLLAGVEVPRTSLSPEEILGWDWPKQLAEVIYVDHYGNAFTGIAADAVGDRTVLRCGAAQVPHARVFGAAPPGEPFWYVNSCGLVEIAVNGGSAAAALGLAIGDAVEMHAL
jgi:S-adenosylmethionine hydrolase